MKHVLSTCRTTGLLSDSRRRAAQESSAGRQSAGHSRRHLCGDGLAAAEEDIIQMEKTQNEREPFDSLRA